MFYEQLNYDIRLEWGMDGLNALAPTSEVIVIIDVLSFTTCVEIAVTRGAVIYPYSGQRELAEQFAGLKGAHLATKRASSANQFSLSPVSLSQIPAGTKLVLPSPNGSTLTLAAAAYAATVAGCLRNARAVADFLQQKYRKISVIPCGERWQQRERLRPALEDLLGAGAVIHYLNGRKSPEADYADRLFQTYADISEPIMACVSGVELREKGFQGDVDLAAQLNVSNCVPLFCEDHYAHERPEILQVSR